MASASIVSSQGAETSAFDSASVRRDSVLEPFQKFKHTPLQHVTEQIRVCDLHLATDDDAAVVFTLRTVPLSGIEECTSISYVWGSPGEGQRSVAITTDGRWHAITSNLHALLQRLRTLGIHKDLWIDALCIDQENKEEKTKQVRLMDKIYSGAKNVVVALDTSAPVVPLASDPVKTALEGLVNNQHLDELACFNNPAAGQSLKTLLQSPWFTRAWTVQEIVLSRQATILYPQGLLPWCILKDALANWNSHRTECCSTFIEGVHSDLRDACYAAYDALESIAYTQRNYSNGQHLLTALVTFKSLSATEEIDKAFAFYSLHSQDDPPPPADYGKEPAQIFIELAEWLLTTWGSLFPLTLEMENDLNLPSWVLSVTSAPFDKNYWKLRLSFFDRYDSSKHLDWTFQHVFPNTLALPGVCIDQIENFTTAAAGFESCESRSELLREWLAWYHNGKPSLSAVVDDVFATTLIAGCVACEEASRRADEDDIAQWKDFLNGFIRDGAPPDGFFPQSLIHCHIAAMYNRRLFRTTSGRYGIGPQCMKRTDSIWVLAGSKLPFILRFSTDGPSMWPTYTLVGPAYVHGNVMDGDGCLPGPKSELCHII